MNDFLDIVTYQKPCRVLDGECHCGMCELAGLTEEYGLYDERPTANLVALFGRCEVTKNPCGTDTWAEGSVCPCAACTAWLAIPDPPFLYSPGFDDAPMETSESFCNAEIRAAERWRRYYTRCSDDACGCEDCKLARAIDATKERRVTEIPVLDPVIMSAQAFVHAHCKQHQLYQAYCAECESTRLQEESKLCDAVFKMEKS